MILLRMESSTVRLLLVQNHRLRINSIIILNQIFIQPESIFRPILTNVWTKISIKVYLGQLWVENLWI